MEQPPIGQEVVGILANGTEALVIWNNDVWKTGVADDPADAIFEEEIIDWRWRIE
jgi:hypothetical protein